MSHALENFGLLLVWVHDKQGWNVVDIKLINQVFTLIAIDPTEDHRVHRFWHLAHHRLQDATRFIPVSNEQDSDHFVSCLCAVSYLDIF